MIPLISDKLMRKRYLMECQVPYGAWDMRVSYDGLNFMVEDRARVPRLHTGYQQHAIQEALDGLDNGRLHRGERQNVKLDANFNSLDDTISLPALAVLLLSGRIRLANGVNKDMIVNDANTTSAAAIIGVSCAAEIDGNDGNQTAGHCIDWTIGGAVNPYSFAWSLELHNLWIHDAYQRDISYVKDTGAYPTLWYHLKTDAGDVYCEKVNDSWFEDLNLNTWVWNYGKSNRLIDIYVGGGWTNGFLFQNFFRNSLTNIKIDHVSQDHMKFTGSNAFNTFGNISITTDDGLSLDDTYAGILLGDTAKYNTFGIVNISDSEYPDAPPAKFLKYGILESGTADYNLFTTVHALSSTIQGGTCKTAGAKLIGANSSIGHLTGTLEV